MSENLLKSERFAHQEVICKRILFRELRCLRHVSVQCVWAFIEINIFCNLRGSICLPITLSASNVPSNCHTIFTNLY